MMQFPEPAVFQMGRCPLNNLLKTTDVQSIAGRLYEPAPPRSMPGLLIQLQHGEKCLLRHLYVSDLAHPLFTRLLLFEQLPLP